jgi:hypothetical protein
VSVVERSRAQVELDAKYTNRLNHIIDRVADKDKDCIDEIWDLLLWSLYGQDAFSQFGYGVYSWNFRQSNGATRLCVKAMESGVPLVAFITSATPRGCIEQMFGCLERGTLKWQKDKYPGI